MLLKEEKKNTFYMLVIFMASFALYAQTITFNYTCFDDREIFLDNKSFFSGNDVDLKKIFFSDAFFNQEGDFYRPLQNLTFRIDTLISGGIASTWTLHLSNVLLFSLIAISIFLLFLKFNISKKIALGATLLYIVHPLFVISVAWLPSRGDLLLTLFGVLSVISFINWTNRIKYSGFWVCLFLIIALFSKETAAFLPLIFLAYFFLFQKNPKIEKRCFFLAISILAIGIAWYSMRSMALTGSTNTLTLKDFGTNLLAIPTFFSQFFFPFEMSPIPSYTWAKTILGIVILFFFSYLFIKSPKKKENLFFVIWFLFLLVPTFFYKVQFLDYLDHRFLLPGVGIFLFLGSLLGSQKENISCLKNNKYFLYLYILVIISFVVITFTKTKYYKEPLLFYNSVIDHNGKLVFAYNNRSIVKQELGDLEGSVNDCNKVLSINNKYVLAYANRATAYQLMKRFDNALEDINTGISLDQKNNKLYCDRSIIKYEMQNYMGALEDVNISLNLKSNFALAYANRGRVKIALGDSIGGFKDFASALDLDTSLAIVYYYRGLVQGSKGFHQKALNDFEKYLELEKDKRLPSIYFDCGAAYYSLQKYDKAIEYFSKAVEKEPNNIRAYKYMITSKCNTNDFTGALNDCTKLLELTNNDKEVLAFKTIIERELSKK